MNICKEELNCRICNGLLTKVFDLGSIYPSGFVNGKETNIPPQPLVLAECTHCGLYQLKHTLDLDLMYRNYWYRSALNKSMVESLNEIVTSIEKIVDINEANSILDIGCNDGTLLSKYSDKKSFKVGFDPAQNLAKEAVSNCDVFFNDYFKYDTLVNELGPIRFKIITSIAMFYDLPDPKQFVLDISKCLAWDGVWVIQFQDLVSMLKSNAFDNICFEHLEYYKISDVKYLVQRFGLEIFNVEYNTVNGGSLRLYVSFKGRQKVSDNVNKFLFREDEYLNNGSNPILDFYYRVQTEKDKLSKLVHRINDSKELLYVLGASTKGNTLLQYYKFDKSLVHKALEVNEDKFGLKTVGSNIPIISESEGLSENPNYLLCLPWHFSDFFIKKLSNYIMNGGRLIFPLPSLTVIGKENLY